MLTNRTSSVGYEGGGDLAAPQPCSAHRFLAFSIAALCSTEFNDRCFTALCVYNFVEFLTFTVVDFMDLLPFATFNTFFRDVFPTPFSFSGILAILSIYKQMVQGDIKSLSFNLPLTPHHRNRGALKDLKTPEPPPTTLKTGL